MISVAQALEIVLQNVRPLRPMRAALAGAVATASQILLKVGEAHLDELVRGLREMSHADLRSLEENSYGQRRARSAPAS